MTFPENDIVLVWLHEELRKAEVSRGHGRIVIEIVDGKAHHGEATVKALFKIDNQ